MTVIVSDEDRRAIFGERDMLKLELIAGESKGGRYA